MEETDFRFSAILLLIMPFSDSTLLKANLIHWGITDHSDLIREELIDEFHETTWI
jgi:hypothetical protein